jgi:thiol-disulfide isomerase/thioredoxin
VPTDDGNQGRTDLYLGPGVTIPFAQDWSVSIDLRGRLYGHAVNAQLDLPVVLDSIGRLFHLESGAHEDDVAASSSGDVLDVVQHGEAAPLNAEPGKWTVFDFWASWCEPCKTLDADLRKLAATDPTIAVRRVNIVDFDSPIAIQELRGVSALPHVRIVGPDQVVRWEGTAPPEDVMEHVRQRR